MRLSNFLLALLLVLSVCISGGGQTQTQPAKTFSSALACADSSGSSTAQSCNTAPVFTVASGDAVLYTTTTTNTGDLTVNINSLGVVHVRKGLGTSVLAAGDMPANTRVMLAYDGTYWEMFTITSVGAGNFDLVAEGGADTTGATDSLPALNTANTFLGSTGGRIYVPCGSYKLSGTWRWTNAANSAIESAGSSVNLVGANTNQCAQFQLLNPLPSATIAASGVPGLTESGNTVTLTATANLSAGFEIGASFTITGAGVAGYNNSGAGNPPEWTVLSVPSATTLTFFNPTGSLGNSGGGTALLKTSLAQPPKAFTNCSAAPCLDTQVFNASGSGGLSNGTHTITYSYYDPAQGHETATAQAFSAVLNSGTSTQQYLINSPDWDGRSQLYMVYIDGNYQGAGGSGASGQYCNDTAGGTYTPPCWLGDGLTVSTIAGSVTVSGSITAASYATGSTTYTATNTFSAGQYARVSGASPLAYNGTFPVSSATGSSFVVTTNVNPGTFTSGGTASVSANSGADFIPDSPCVIEGRTPSGPAVGLDSGPDISRLLIVGNGFAGCGYHNLSLSRTVVHNNNMTGFQRPGGIGLWFSGWGNNNAATGANKVPSDEPVVFAHGSAANWKGIVDQPPGAIMGFGNDVNLINSPGVDAGNGTYACPASGVGPGSGTTFPMIDQIPVGMEGMGNQGMQLSSMHIDIGTASCNIGLLEEGNLNLGTSPAVLYNGRDEDGATSSSPRYSDAIYIDGNASGGATIGEIVQDCGVSSFGTCLFASANSQGVEAHISVSIVVGNVTPYVDNAPLGNNTITCAGRCSWNNKTAILAGTAYTNATTTFSNVVGGSGPTMQFNVGKNANYSFTCNIVWSASVATAGPKFQFTGPSSPTAVQYYVFQAVTATTEGTAAATAFSTSLNASGTTVVATTNEPAIVDLGLLNGANGGTVTLQAAAQGAGTLTIQPGSYCRIN